MAVLVWESSGRRVVVPLDRAVLLVGRDDASDVRLDDPSVSRRHAVIEAGEGKVSVSDLGSTSGTRINGARLTPDLASTIEPGDFIHFGRVMVTMLKTPPPTDEAAAEEPAPTPQEPRRKRAPAPAPTRPERPERGRAPTTATPRTEKEPSAVNWPLVGAVAGLVGAGIAAALLFGGGDDEERSAVAPEPSWEQATREPEPSKEPAPVAPEPAPVEPEPEAPVMPPKEDPKPEPEGPPRAEAGALPPDADAAEDRFPLLLELTDGSYRPVRILRWSSASLECAGGDERLYTVAQNKISRVLERAFLLRLAEARRQEAQDAPARIELASWCARRHLRRAALEILDVVLRADPRNAEAQALKQTLEGGRR